MKCCRCPAPPASAHGGQRRNHSTATGLRWQRRRLSRGVLDLPTLRPRTALLQPRLPRPGSPLPTPFQCIPMVANLTVLNAGGASQNRPQTPVFSWNSRHVLEAQPLIRVFRQPKSHKINHLQEHSTPSAFGRYTVTSQQEIFSLTKHSTYSHLALNRPQFPCPVC